MRTDHDEDMRLPGSYLLPPEPTAREQAAMEYFLVRVRAGAGLGCAYAVLGKSRFLVTAVFFGFSEL